MLLNNLAVVPEETERGMKMNDSKKKYVLVNGGKELGHEADSLKELLRSIRFSASENEEGLSDYFVGMADVYGAEEWSRLVENYHFEKMASGHESALFTNYAKSWLSSTDMPRTPEPHQCVVRILGDYHKHLLFDGEPTLGVVNWTLKDCFDDESYEILVKDADTEGPASAVETSKPVVSGKRWRLEREGERDANRIIGDVAYDEGPEHNALDIADVRQK